MLSPLKPIFSQNKKNIHNWWKRLDQNPVPNIYMHTHIHRNIWILITGFISVNSTSRYSLIHFSFPLISQNNSCSTCFKKISEEPEVFPQRQYLAILCFCRACLSAFSLELNHPPFSQIHHQNPV